MKILCYLILIIAFLMYYQENPVYTIIIIAIGIGVYLFFKSRKGKTGVLGNFFGGNSTESEERMNDLITFFILTQMFNNSSHQDNDLEKKKSQKMQEEIEKKKQEVLELLEFG